MAQASDKKCWHIMYMAYCKPEISQMEVCVDKSTTDNQATEYVCSVVCRKDCHVFILCRDEEDMKDDDLVGHTRTGLPFSLSANAAVVTTKLVKYVFKIPGRLQWLVLEKHGYCWVFFSKYQQRLKCRCQHPNNPGMMWATCSGVIELGD